MIKWMDVSQSHSRHDAQNNPNVNAWMINWPYIPKAFTSVAELFQLPKHTTSLIG
jgi:hypothetical protein